MEKQPETKNLTNLIEKIEKGHISCITLEGKSFLDPVTQVSLVPKASVFWHHDKEDGRDYKGYMVDGEAYQLSNEKLPILFQEAQRAAEFLLKNTDLQKITIDDRFMGYREVFLKEPDRIGPTLKEVFLHLEDRIDGVPVKFNEKDLESKISQWYVDEKAPSHVNLVYQKEHDYSKHIVVYKENEITNVYKEKIYEGISKGDLTSVKQLEYILEKTYEKSYEVDR